MKKPTYEVSILENSIHLDPKTAVKEDNGGKKPKRMIFKRAEVYQWPNDKIDVLFRDKDAPRRQPTITELASFPFCRIMHSKRRVNIIISFGKKELELMETQMIMKRDEWFNAIRAQIEKENGGA